MALFLRDDEVNQAVSMDEMLDAIEEMQRHFGQGEVMNLARRKIIGPGGMLSVMGGGLFYNNILGVKTYTVVKGKYSFQVSIYDADTGELMCYTQANRLGQLRTGATTGIAVKHLVQTRRGHRGHHRHRLPGPGPVGSGMQGARHQESQGFQPHGGAPGCLCPGYDQLSGAGG